MSLLIPGVIKQHKNSKSNSASEAIEPKPSNPTCISLSHLSFRFSFLLCYAAVLMLVTFCQYFDTCMSIKVLGEPLAPKNSVTQWCLALKIATAQFMSIHSSNSGGLIDLVVTQLHASHKTERCWVPNLIGTNFRSNRECQYDTGPVFSHLVNSFSFIVL